MSALKNTDLAELVPLLGRVADALERLSPPRVDDNTLEDADAFVWHADESYLEPILEVSRINLHLLQGIESQCETLGENTRRFAAGLPANNALLWGARGMGKSSLVKALHGAVQVDKYGDKQAAVLRETEGSLNLEVVDLP